MSIFIWGEGRILLGGGIIQRSEEEDSCNVFLWNMISRYDGEAECCIRLLEMLMIEVLG